MVFVSKKKIFHPTQRLITKEMICFYVLPEQKESLDKDKSIKILAFSSQPQSPCFHIVNGKRTAVTNQKCVKLLTNQVVTCVTRSTFAVLSLLPSCCIRSLITIWTFHKYCVSVAGWTVGSLVESAQKGIFQWAWSGTIVIQCSNKEVIPNGDELTLCQGLVLSGKINKLDSILGRFSSLHFTKIRWCWAGKGFIYLPGCCLMSSPSVDCSTVFWKTIFQMRYHLFVPIMEHLLLVR